MTEKITAKYIVIERAEGLSALLVNSMVVVKSFAEANEYLQNLAIIDTPKGYDKTDFTVVWNDGTTYTGTYMLSKQDLIGGSLIAHMLANLEHLRDIHRNNAELMEIAADLTYNYEISLNV